MRETRNKKTKIQKSGFTIMELLIVVTIIAVISVLGYAVLKPDEFRNASGDSIRRANIKKLADAAETFIDLEGRYPQNETDLRSVPYVEWPNGNPLPSDVYTYSYDSSTQTYIISVPISTGCSYEYHSEQGQLYENCSGVLEPLIGGEYTN